MENQAKQVLDMRPGKGFTTAQSDEHQRRWSERGWEHALANGNYDPTREHLNFEIVKGGKVQPIDKSRSIPEKIREILHARGIVDPNEGLKEPKYRTVANFIFGGSRERMHELAYGDQKVNLRHNADNSQVERRPEIETWAKDVYDFVARRYGEDNIAAFYVHLDETNPHIHCTLLPIDNGKFAYKRIFAGKDKMDYARRNSELHDAFAVVNEKWGLNRGSSIAETKAHHRPTEEYRRWLDDVCIGKEEEIAAHQRALDDLKVEIQIAERKVKGLSTMIANAKQERDSVEAKIIQLENRLEAGQGDRVQLESEIRDLRDELASLNLKLDDKKSKLKDADAQLETLQKDMADIRQQTEELKKQRAGASKDLQGYAKNQLSMVAFEDVVNEFNGWYRELDESERHVLELTLLKDLADRGNYIMKCALMLYVGMVDQATAFAEGHGGGGGGSSLPWGRDDKENDREWARQCMQMARRMMRPSNGRKQGR